MKRLLLILSLALMAVACEKEDPNEDPLYGCKDIKFFHNSEPLSVIRFDKETGGTITIEAEVDAFVAGLGGMKDNEMIVESFYEWDIPEPEYIIKLEQIKKHKEFVTEGCKVVPDGLRKFTITVEPNCDFSFYEVCFSKIIKSKKYGEIADYAGTSIQVIPQ